MVYPRPGQRICVVGTSGAGKTVVAEALAERLGLRYVSSDALIWRANWEPVPRDETLLDDARGMRAAVSRVANELGARHSEVDPDLLATTYVRDSDGYWSVLSKTIDGRNGRALRVAVW